MSRSGRRAVETTERILSEEKTPSFPPGRFRRLWREYLRPVRWLAVLVVLATLVTSVPASIFALTGRFLLDHVLLFGRTIPEADMPHHVRLLLVYFSLNMGVWTAVILASLVRALVVLRVGRRFV